MAKEKDEGRGESLSTSERPEAERRTKSRSPVSPVLVREMAAAGARALLGMPEPSTQTSPLLDCMTAYLANVARRLGMEDTVFDGEAETPERLWSWLFQQTQFQQGWNATRRRIEAYGPEGSQREVDDWVEQTALLCEDLRRKCELVSSKRVQPTAYTVFCIPGMNIGIEVPHNWQPPKQKGQDFLSCPPDNYRVGPEQTCILCYGPELSVMGYSGSQPA